MGKGGDSAKCCTGGGPGYASPLDAMNNGPREKLMYVPAIIPTRDRPDYLCTVDVDPTSETYSQVIHRLPMPNVGDELHHLGWNACSSCHSDSGKSRSRLILPTVTSGRIYSVDTATDPRAPSLAAVAEPEDIEKEGVSYLHSTHCLPSGNIMVSTMGDPQGGAKGNFLLLDQDLKVKGTWAQESTAFGYDFWYQPRHNVMVSSEWGTPNKFKLGFNPADVPTSYGDRLTFWDWEKREKIQEVSLGTEGLIPLETRFLHDPSKAQGFVGAALASNIVYFSKGADGKWETSAVIKQEWTKLNSWVLPACPPLITDILVSLDDRWLYFSNWLRGDIVQYDISDPANPKFASRIWIGGVARKGGKYEATGGLPEDTPELPEIPTVKGKHLYGGPQMLQLSLDGKRLYVTNSLLVAWDQQFYPDMCEHGSYMLQIDVDSEKGGLTLNHNFMIDFSAEPEGPVLAHECRYPGMASPHDAADAVSLCCAAANKHSAEQSACAGGDCSSDIWL